MSPPLRAVPRPRRARATGRGGSRSSSPSSSTARCWSCCSIAELAPPITARATVIVIYVVAALYLATLVYRNRAGWRRWSNRGGARRELPVARGRGAVRALLGRLRHRGASDFDASGDGVEQRGAARTRGSGSAAGRARGGLLGARRPRRDLRAETETATAHRPRGAEPRVSGQPVPPAFPQPAAIPRDRRACGLRAAGRVRPASAGVGRAEIRRRRGRRRDQPVRRRSDRAGGLAGGQQLDRQPDRAAVRREPHGAPGDPAGPAAQRRGRRDPDHRRRLWPDPARRQRRAAAGLCRRDRARDQLGVAEAGAGHHQRGVHPVRERDQRRGRGRGGGQDRLGREADDPVRLPARRRRASIT